MTGLLPVLFFLSGLCALVYEVVWTRWLGLVFGNFMTATAVVLAVFMAGLAIGSAVIGRFADRLPPARAVRLYGGLEALLAGAAAVSPLLLGTFPALYPKIAVAGSPVLGRLLLSIPVLLVPAFLMGGTLPALVRALAAERPAALGPLYAVNTAGAAAGPLLAAFVLLPAAGMTRTLLGIAALNAAVAGVALWLAGRWPESGPGEPAREDRRAFPLPDLLPLGLGFWSGMLALACEVALIRQVKLTITGGSVYGLAIVLSAFLVGMSVGAAILRRFPPRTPGGGLVAFAGAMGVVYVFSLMTPFWDLVPLALVRLWAATESFSVLSVFNCATVFALTMLPAAAFGYALPALSAGLAFPGPRSIGRLFAVNTAGAATGALLAGFVLLPVLGLSRSLLAIGGGAIAAAAGAVAFAPAGAWRFAALAAAPVLLGLLPVMPRPDPAVMNAGMYNRAAHYVPGKEWKHGLRKYVHEHGVVVFERDGLFGHVVVRRHPGWISFSVDGKPDGSSALGDMKTQAGSTHLAALVHPRPRKALVIGLGTGISAGSLGLHPEVGRMDVVEIEPVQVAVARIFDRHNYGVLRDPRLKVHFDDARHWLALRSEGYDIIVSEPSNLFVQGMVNLYTREFFSQARARLNPGGVLVVFAHYYQTDPDGIRGLLRTFLEAFPQATYWVHDTGDSFLLGVNGDLQCDLGEWERRIRNPMIRGDLARIGISSPLDLLAGYLWGPREMAEFAGDGSVCTDDFPYLEFATARVRWSQAGTKANLTMLIGAPVRDPVPLGRETAALRVELGDAYFRQAWMNRARREYQRALELQPGFPSARKKLKLMEKIEREFRERESRGSSS